MRRTVLVVLLAVMLAGACAPAPGARSRSSWVIAATATTRSLAGGHPSRQIDVPPRTPLYSLVRWKHLRVFCIWRLPFRPLEQRFGWRPGPGT